MRIEEDVKLDFKDVLIRPKRSTLRSRQEVDLVRRISFKHAQTSWTGVPIIAANMDHVGTFPMADSLVKHQLLTAIHKHASMDEWQQLANKSSDTLAATFVSAGSGKQGFEQLKTTLAKTNIPFICLDVANGYTEYFVSFVRQVREAFPDKIIMAGNVVTGEMVEELILSGADIVKIGIGPGSVCTTRLKTGVGYPQLSAIIECADAAHGLGGQVCADGGCTSSGDMAKAFAAGADFVMLGGLLAGHDEASGEVKTVEGKPVKEFYGMSSMQAMQRHYGEVANYRASEGKCVHVPYRGPVEDTVFDLLGGLRSTCTYVGAGSLKELPKRTTFIRVTQQLNPVFE